VIIRPDGSYDDVTTNAEADDALPGHYDVTCVWSQFNELTRSQHGRRLSGGYASGSKTPIHLDLKLGVDHSDERIERLSKKQPIEQAILG